MPFLSKNKSLLFAFLFFLGVVGTHSRLIALYQIPYPPFSELKTRHGGIQDLVFLAFGFRDMAADVAWVQFIQYMGGAEILDADYTRDYKLTQYFALRVTRLDPYFKTAYIYAAGLLAWLRSIQRYEEALEVLEEGIRYNPEYWPLQSYAAAIGYRGNVREKMISMLWKAVNHPDSPVLIKSVLANSLKEKKQYQEAIAVWLLVLNDPKAVDSHPRAEAQIKEIQQHLAREKK